MPWLLCLELIGNHAERRSADHRHWQVDATRLGTVLATGHVMQNENAARATLSGGVAHVGGLVPVDEQRG